MTTRPDLPAELDVVALGNAIVDVLAHADDHFLAELGVEKGSMRLVDAEEAAAIYARMGPGIEASGGSAANTTVGVASLGGTAGFIGKVRDDQLGAVYAHDIRAAGVYFDTPAATTGPPTAQSLILITPDAQRTMNTFLGASTGLEPGDVDASLIRRAKVTYLEGYLWDPPAAKAAFRTAMETAELAGAKVAFTLSDAFCVDRFRDEFIDLIERDVDILFANEAEVLSLFEVDDIEAGLRLLEPMCEVAAVTRSEHGSVVLAGGERVAVPAHPVAAVVDTTGAGDLYAAGFLFGLVRGEPLERCARIGSICAAEVISHVGPRPQEPLDALVARELGD